MYVPCLIDFQRLQFLGNKGNTYKSINEQPTLIEAEYKTKYLNNDIRKVFE
jgi:hypothetical protein